MKKPVLCFILAFIILTFCSCGDTSNAKVYLVPSEHYSEEKLNEISEIIKSYFVKGFDDCSLLSLDYDESLTEELREKNTWLYRRTFEPKSVTDSMVWRMTYSCLDSDHAEEKTVEVTLVQLDGKEWIVADVGSA